MIDLKTQLLMECSVRWTYYRLKLHPHLTEQEIVQQHHNNIQLLIKRTEEEEEEDKNL